MKNMSEVVDIDCAEGVELEFDTLGEARYVRVDLDIHPVIRTFLKQNGLVNGAFCIVEEDDEEDDSWLIPTEAVEVDCRNIKWSKKMLESFEELKNGQIRPLNLEKFRNV